MPGLGLCLMSNLKSEILMKRSSDVSLPRALLSIQQMTVRPVLAMIYCEGLIEYREITDMNVIPRDGKDQVSSMAQVGLHLPGSESGKLHVEGARGLNHEDDFSQSIGLHTALSPNACAAVTLDEQHLASLKFMQFADEHTSDQIDEGVYATEQLCVLADKYSACRSDPRSLCNAVFDC